MQGWIKLHRKLLDSALMKKGAYLQVWIALLLQANHDRTEFIFNNKKQIVMPGQLIIGRKKLSKITRIPQTTIERILKYFENERQIGQQTTSKFRIITILNWRNYQIDGQQMDIKRTTSGHHADTYKNDKNEENDKNYGGGSSQNDFQNKMEQWMQELKEEGEF